MEHQPGPHVFRWDRHRSSLPRQNTKQSSKITPATTARRADSGTPPSSLDRSDMRFRSRSKGVAPRLEQRTVPDRNTRHSARLGQAGRRGSAQVSRLRGATKRYRQRWAQDAALRQYIDTDLSSTSGFDGRAERPRPRTIGTDGSSNLLRIVFSSSRSHRHVAVSERQQSPRISFLSSAVPHRPTAPTPRCSSLTAADKDGVGDRPAPRPEGQQRSDPDRDCSDTFVAHHDQ